MKVISLMMQLTKNMMLSEAGEQDKTVRSSYTKYFRVLYMYMILNSSTFSQKKDVFALKVPTVSKVYAQCKRAIRNEFKGIDIPEWPNDKGLSKAAQRCNCMMLMACFIACKDYENPADYTTLLYWLNEIKWLYIRRTKDCNQTIQDWMQEIVLRRFFGNLHNKYCTMIAFEFAERIVNKKSDMETLGSNIWRFQQPEIDLGKFSKPISEVWWIDDGTSWIPEDNIDSKKLKSYLENNCQEVVPALIFEEALDYKGI